ncbi:MAG TPA: SRPBCC family protein [Acidimicrobiia bacterium]|nr:SRPBCC family protein [Acidimicrobiia bacterium]
MAVVTNQTLVACTPEQLFDYCVDNRNELAWNPTAVSIEKVTDGPVGLGTKFLAKWKEASAVEVECIEFDRPRRWVPANDGPIAIRATGIVDAEGDKSRLTFEFDARPIGWFRVVFPLFMLMMRKQEKGNMTYLRRGAGTPNHCGRAESG